MEREEDKTNIHTRAIKMLETAIRAITDSRKDAYQEAVDRVPHLVETESPPIRFLRFVGFNNASEAADLLCSYWKQRKEIFGERAFFPMSLSGDCALDESDIAFLNSGCFAFLPNCGSRSVLFCDTSKLVRGSQQRRLRVSFYLWSILSENEENQKDGYVVVLPLSCARLDDSFIVCEDVVLRSIPVRINSVHLLCCPSQANKRTFYGLVLPKVLQDIENLADNKEIIHVADVQEAFAKKLESHGFPKSALPESLGGTWSFSSNVAKWRRERSELESGRYGKVMPVAPETTPGQSSGVSFPVMQTAGNWDAKTELFPSTRSELKYEAQSTDDQLPGTEENLAGKQSSTIRTFSESTKVCASKPRPSTEVEGKSVRVNHAFDADPVVGEREDIKDTIHETATLLDQRRREMEEAFLRIPDEEKEAYLEALKRVPHLVKSEPAGPISFLRAENLDAKAAASRMVRFWSLRKLVFGEKAFLPMNQTGEGTLSYEDLQLLRKGSIMNLGRGSGGRLILCLDRSRIEGLKLLGNKESVLRVLFYFVCVACEDETTQRNGLVCLRVVDPKLPFGRAKAKAVTDILSMWAPFTSHTLVHHQPGARRLVEDSIVPEERRFLGDPVKHLIHTGESPRELAGKICGHGIPEASLPAWLGGQWTDEKFELWQRERVTIETQRLKDICVQSAGIPDATFEKKVAEATQLNVRTCDSLEASPERGSYVSSITEEQKLSTGSRRRIRGNLEDLSLAGNEAKKSRGSKEDGA